MTSQTEAAQKLLADAGAVLASTLDYASIGPALARIAVPAFADGCVIDLIEPDGRARRLAVEHVDADTAERLRKQQPSGELDSVEALRALDHEHGLVVPLQARGKTFGTIAFLLHGKRRFAEGDVAVAEELARRTAAAVDNARLYETALLANQSKTDFLAVMSHELRTPLTAIMGYADLLLTAMPEPLPDRATGYVDRVRAAAQHLLGLIEQILIFARLDSNQEDVHPERVNPADVLKAAASLIEPVAAERGLSFVVKPYEDGEIVETDLTKLRQILLNLLSNAVRFTDEGTVSIGATVENDSVAFRVTDTGIGIAGDHLERVFDPFWQVDQSSTRRVGGTGLGLSVARRLARQLGGEIDVTSELGSGTTFLVRLPLRWTLSANGAARRG